jgi:hypothetical protein
LAQVIQQKFNYKTVVPQWREKRFLFTPEGEAAPEERVEEVSAPAETFTTLLNRLDRSYKRLRRKLKREKSKGEESIDPRRLRQLGEINEKLEELESEL